MQIYTSSSQVSEIFRKLFSQTVNLKRYKKIHNERRLYKCVVCDVPILKAAGFTKHIQTQPGEHHRSSYENSYLKVVLCLFDLCQIILESCSL